ncbi:glycoside hydrolase family 95 protein [Hymenobacter coccineus]|uniref:Alpha-L-fucosidase n=1 Tax=Hymenobacter coccineus TaxID=1908235 RepID=A0A1G1TK80_9BACT|nr:glycoside hydrolase family 95 protein [Hymenobacter coccineus]OGX91259.1 alpha-L-fucosidase [Hymenobacter coccineus]
MIDKLLRACCLALALAGAAPAWAQQPAGPVLWYRQSAKDWNEALPVGNGRLGAMLFGRPAEELMQLNESSLWTGGPANPDPNPAAPTYLPEVRRLLFAGDNAAAAALMKKMQGPNSNAYQPLGDLLLRQPLAGAATDYYRSLDLATATATTRFTAGGVAYTREVFVTAPDQVIVIRLTASKKNALNFNLSLRHPLPFQRAVEGPGELVLRGKALASADDGPRAPDEPLAYEQRPGCNGMRFQIRLKVVRTDGTVTADSVLRVAGATEALLLVSGATSFNGFDKCPDADGKNETAEARRWLAGAQARPFAELRARHVADYQAYFRRVALTLAGAPGPNLPTDERLARYKTGQPDAALEALYFDFGRYLLISSSRPGGQAANLQGLWNPLVQPPWRSNYTTNINLQMNYWPAEVANLSELQEPLRTQIQHMATTGAATARTYYRAAGWALHHNSDIWGPSNPVGDGTGDPRWANWALGGPWLSQHLFEHYRFTQDRAYLRQTAYPLMRGAAEFCLDWLVEHDGHLVTAPSTSPENSYRLPNGREEVVTIASTMDMSIIRDLFGNVLAADSVLGAPDAAFAARVRAARARLYPLHIGRKGNLQEWYGDFEDVDPQHRHVSQLFGLHPGREISPLTTPALAAAARQTLLVRGDAGTGWSKAWKINFWARLLDGNHAYKMYQELLKNSTLNNLFDTHPPFQIDGNFGATAGLTEMLLQSQLADVHLLPALPAAWATGAVRGLVARGGFVVDMTWKSGRLATARLTSRAGAPCMLRTTTPVQVLRVQAKSATATAGGVKYYLTSFPTKAGVSYEVVAK